MFRKSANHVSSFPFLPAIITISIPGRGGRGNAGRRKKRSSEQKFSSSASSEAAKAASPQWTYSITAFVVSSSNSALIPQGATSKKILSGFPLNQVVEIILLFHIFPICPSSRFILFLLVRGTGPCRDSLPGSVWLSRRRRRRRKN